MWVCWCDTASGTEMLSTGMQLARGKVEGLAVEERVSSLVEIKLGEDHGVLEATGPREFPGTSGANELVQSSGHRPGGLSAAPDTHLDEELEGAWVAVGCVAQELEVREQVLHTVLDGGTAQAPPAVESRGGGGSDAVLQLSDQTVLGFARPQGLSRLRPGAVSMRPWTMNTSLQRHTASAPRKHLHQSNCTWGVICDPGL